MKLDATGKRLLAAGDRLVLADHLQNLGEPWGELIALQHQPPSPEVDAAIAAVMPRVVGELHLATALVWDRGFVASATIGCSTSPRAITTVAHKFRRTPIASAVKRIAVAPTPTRIPTDRDWAAEQPLVDPWPANLLGTVFPPGLTHIGFGGTAAACAFVQLPSYDAISRAYPHIERLDLAGHPRTDPGVLRLDKLVALDVQLAHATPTALADLTRWELPRLTELSVSIGGDVYCVIDDVYPPKQRNRPRYPKTYTPRDLEKLFVDRVALNEGALIQVVEALPPTVTRLKLRGAGATLDLVREIRAHPAVANVALDLPDDLAPAFFYRYVATVE